MKSKVLILALMILLLGGQMSLPVQRAWLQQRLNELANQGRAYRFLDNTTIEVDNPVAGEKRAWSLVERSENDIRAWAASRGIPILEVNPATVDTSRYTGWYTYWTSVPLSNGEGDPILIGDADHNGKPEVYGLYQDSLSTDFETRIYEIEPNGSSTFRFRHLPRRGSSRQFISLRRDSLLQMYFTFGDSAFIYRQDASNTLPVIRDFAHAMFTCRCSFVQRVRMTNLDNDTLLDFLYSGTETDTTMPIVDKTYVAEWNPETNNFQRVWSTQLNPPPSGFLAGYSAGDHDADGKVEFVASEVFGKIHLVENVSNNCYAETWTDSVPFVNVYYQISGDVDNDGKPEFFIGAHMGDGSWITMFEADSDNHYSPKILFHLFTSSGADAPTYMTNDVDGDGKLELVFFTGATLYVFKSNDDNNYYLWYLKRENAGDALQVYDCNGDGKKDLVSSKRMLNGNRFRFFSDIYIANNTAASVVSGSKAPEEIYLSQNYPNPFNPSTTITYSIPNASAVALTIVDLLGREVARLFDGTQTSGTHSLRWDTTRYTSGIYFCRLQAGATELTIKLLLIR